MTKPEAAASCHPGRANFYMGRCQQCFQWMRDPNAPCPHEKRAKDDRRYYSLRRARGLGDGHGTPRASRSLRSIEDPTLRMKLVARKRRLRAYGLSLDDYDKRLQDQGGVCAVCRRPPAEGVDLNVDHDQRCCPSGGSCGACVRGLLCHGCNIRLGQLESRFVSRSVDYLLRFGSPALAPSDEVITSDSQTGGRKGQKLARFDLIPPRALWSLAEVYGRGAIKYQEEDNWLRGYNWSLSFAALMRHVQAFWDGQLYSEDGNHHLACAAWHCFALLEFEALGLGTDDRPHQTLPALEEDDRRL